MFICSHCKARLFKGEKTAGTVAAPVTGLCCNLGKVRLEPLQPLPPDLQRLYVSNDVDCRDFQDHIRAYNTVFGMTSSGIKIDDRHSYGVSQLRIQGGIYHRMGPLIPDEGVRPAFLQMYILDDSAQLNARGEVMQGLDRTTLSVI